MDAILPGGELTAPASTDRRAWSAGAATVLMVGAGFSQRRAIAQLCAQGVRVVAVDGDPAAPGFGEASVAEVVDFSDLQAVIEVAERHRVDGVLTVASDRAVPVVAAVAERLGLPGIGRETAHAMTNKIAMRERLAACGVPQPRFVPLHRPEDREQARAELVFPVVVKAADSGGQRGLFLAANARELAELLPQSLAVSRSGEALVEEFHEGLEMNAIVVVRAGSSRLVTLSDRLRPPGAGFGVGWTHLYPASVSAAVFAEAERVVAAAVTACGLRDGIAFPQLLVDREGTVRVVEIGARIAAGQMSELVRHAVGVELVSVALLQALGQPVPEELVRPSRSQPLAVLFLTAEPGPLPTGKVRRFSGLERALAQPGVVEAELYLTEGETIRPVALDIDRRGYVLALGTTSAEALERAERAAALFLVEVE